MEKIYGIEKRNDKIVRFTTGKVILFWGFFNEIDKNNNIIHYQYQHTFYTNPSNKDIVKFLIDFIDENTNNKILTGYVWKNINVYLSTENQFNFKAAYDLAIQTEGESLPITFKLGEDENNIPQYYTFNDMETFNEFYINAILFIQETLKKGWDEKDLVLNTFK